MNVVLTEVLEKDMILKISFLSFMRLPVESARLYRNRRSDLSLSPHSKCVIYVPYPKTN